MTWNEALDEILTLSQDWVISERQREALNMVLDADWGSSKDGQSARERQGKRA